jgi:hypothetical protein
MQFYLEKQMFNIGTRARGEGSKFVQDRKTADVLAVMVPLEPSMTSEVTDELGWPWRRAYEVLNRLADEKEIRKKKPEARRVIWIRTE